MKPAVRRVANWVNLSTPLGLLLAGAAGARLRETPDGHHLATGYRWRFPVAGAFTVGDVVLTRARRIGPEPTSPLPAPTWEHELRHSERYAWCAGLPFLPAYAGACAWSYVTRGDLWSGNLFEARAGLTAGGYVRAPLRPWIRRLRDELSRPRRPG